MFGNASGKLVQMEIFEKFHIIFRKNFRLIFFKQKFTANFATRLVFENSSHFQPFSAKILATSTETKN